MKQRVFLIIAMVLCCAMSLFAQSNNKISYQAVVRDSQNWLVANKAVNVTVRVFNGDATNPAYSEQHNDVHTNLNGLISLMIGDGTPASGEWSSIDWRNARVETDVTLDGTLLGTLNMPLTAVPYAMYADDVNPSSGTVQGIYNNLADNYYTKTQTDALLSAVPVASGIYTKAETDALLNGKADAANVYSKTETDGLLNAKADASDVYTKGEVDSKFADTANYARKSALTAVLDSLNRRIDSVIAVMNSLPKMVEERYIVEEAGQTEFTLAHEARTDCVIRLYVNGVMIGGNYNGVLTLDDADRTKVTYVPAQNNGYALKANAKVTFVYWY